jgi:hypothetical protein
MTYQQLSQYVCSKCGSDHLGWDAWADENGQVIGVMDFNQCLDAECGAESTAVLRIDLETQGTAEALERVNEQEGAA